jgi:hypothetical protein
MRPPAGHYKPAERALVGNLERGTFVAAAALGRHLLAAVGVPGSAIHSH